MTPLHRPPTLPGRALLCLALLCLASPHAHAAYQTCNGEVADPNAVRCPDGSIPSYQPGDPPTAPTPASPTPGGTFMDLPRSATAIFGVWHTNMPGIGYRTAVDVPGSYLLTGPIGLGAGDLTIGTNGYYAWNAFRARSGPWTKGVEPGSITLFDEVGGGNWNVTIINGLMSIKKGEQTYTGHR